MLSRGYSHEVWVGCGLDLCKPDPVPDYRYGLGSITYSKLIMDSHALCVFQEIDKESVSIILVKSLTRNPLITIHLYPCIITLPAIS